MKQPPENPHKPFTSSTHEPALWKPLFTRDGLNAAARKTSGVIGWIYSLFHAAAMLLFGLSIGAMFGALAGSWLLRSGFVPAALRFFVSRWSWAVGGVLGLALALWLVARWLQVHRSRAQHHRVSGDFDTSSDTMS